MVQVIVIAGSESDRALIEKAEKSLGELGISFKSHVASAHRNPEKVKKIVTETDASVFIAIAGLSAALPGVVASHTIRPVIGVPKEAKLMGLDSLLSIVQMPPGIPVATVGIDNAKNAALLAGEIIAISDGKVADSLKKYREENR